MSKPGNAQPGKKGAVETGQSGNTDYVPYVSRKFHQYVNKICVVVRYHFFLDVLQLKCLFCSRNIVNKHVVVY